MKKLGITFPLVQYGKDELIDVSEAWSLDEKRNVQVTSSVGYVPLEKRISAMVNAGITLEGMKDEFYGLDVDDDDDDLDLVQDYDSKIELMRSCKERSARLSKSFQCKKQDKKQDSVPDSKDSGEGKKQDSVHEGKDSGDYLSEEHSGDKL